MVATVSIADDILRNLDQLGDLDSESAIIRMHKRTWTEVMIGRGSDGYYMTRRGPVPTLNEPDKRLFGPWTVELDGSIPTGRVVLRVERSFEVPIL